MSWVNLVSLVLVAAETSRVWGWSRTSQGEVSVSDERVKTLLRVVAPMPRVG